MFLEFIPIGTIVIILPSMATGLTQRHCTGGEDTTEPVFLNVYGAQESIPRNEFRQPM
jgi:hypothetical protein